MANSFDTDNLIYVTKQYETEVKEKAKQIYANDEVAITIENIDKQLNDILLEMNDKLGFVTEKISDADIYLEGVHTQIDSVQVFHDLLVSDGIKNTKSHPSVTAFKSDRSETKYDNYDFINKSIELTPQSNLLKITGEGGISENDKMHSFIFNMDEKEYIKIIEFSLTYKQTPNIITISKGENDTKIANRTSTVSVNRIISGRFFLIRHDPINAPSEFIIKAIIENSDNTGNIIDRKILDVKEYVKNQKLSYILDDGPQFDMYFTIDNNDDSGLKVSIGKIIPYRYVMEKKYLDFATGEETTNFNLFDATRGKNSQNIYSHNIEEIFYSKNLNTTFIVDKTNKKISYNIGGNKLNSRVLSSIDDFNFTNGDNIHEFWVKDVGNYVFIRIKDDHQDTTYVGAGSILSLVNLGVPIYDAKKLSSDEIVVLRSNWLYFNTANNTISTDIFVNIDDVGEPNFEKCSDIVEINDTRAVVFITAEDGLYYKIKEKNTTTRTYASTTGESYKYKLTTEGFDNSISNLGATKSKLNVCETISGVYASLKLINNDNSVDLVYFINKLTKTGISYNFEIQRILQELNLKSNISNNYVNGVKKIISTSLLDFIISEDNKLYVIDEERIVKAISFDLIENLGYTDKNSVIYMKSENNQDEYYLVDNAYLQNVQDVVETPNGIFIIDDHGIYALESTKNLKCVLNVDSNNKIVKYLKDYNKTGTAGAAIVDAKTDSSINKIYNVYRNDYLLKDISTKKLRYNYIDLFDNEKYQLFTTVDAEYKADIPIIEFTSILYCSFVDHLSPIYNTVATNKIVYSNDIALQDIPTAQSYVLSSNKYGFIKYDNILSFDDDKLNRISDINEVKKIKIIHNASDSYTLNDALDAITELIVNYANNIKQDRVILQDYNYESKWSIYNDDKIRYDSNDSARLNRQEVYTKYGVYALLSRLSGNNDLIHFRKYTRKLHNAGNVQFGGSANINTMFGSAATDFNVICLDDNLGTSFISNGNEVFKDTAWTLNTNNGKCENFKVPFTPNIDNSYSYSKILDDNDNEMQNIRKFDDIVYMWNKLEGEIFQYNLAQNKLISTRIKCPYLLDFIKIGDDFHLFYSENLKLKYRIEGNRHEEFPENYLQISNYSQPIDTNSEEGEGPVYIGIPYEIKAHVYNFNPQPIVCLSYYNIANNILKYDIDSKTFVNSIIDSNSTYDTGMIQGSTSLIFAKIGDTIYGSTQGRGSAGIFGKLFIYDIENDRIKNLDNPLIDYAYRVSEPINRLVFSAKHDLIFNKPERYIASTCGFVKYIDGIDNLTYKQDLTLIPSGQDCWAISEPIPYNVNLNGESYNDFDLISIINNNGSLYINSYKNNKPIPANKIGGEDWKLKYGTKYGYVPIGHDSEFDENTTYYILDYLHTQFSPIPNFVLNSTSNFESSTGSYSSRNRPTRIFKYIPLDNNIYHPIDTNIIKYPVPGFEYYTLEINGEYVRSSSKTFDPLKTYYLKDCKFEEYSPDDAVDVDAKYYMSCDLVFRVAERSDFIIDGINISFKSELQYFISDQLYDENDYFDIDNIDFINHHLDTIDSLKPIHKLDDQYITFFGTNNDTLYYNITDLSQLYNDIDNDVLNHRTISHCVKLNTKFGTFGIFKFDIGSIRVSNFKYFFARCSEDARIIYEIYFEVSIDSATDNPLFGFYETSKYLFIVNEATNKTYRYIPESMSLSEPVANMSMKHIVEYEDGKIYGKNKTENALIFYKFNDSEGVTPHFDSSDTVSYSDSIENLKIATRYNKNGNKETYLYGTGSLHYKWYKFCQNNISPAFVNKPYGMISPIDVKCGNNRIYITTDLNEIFFFNPDDDTEGWFDYSADNWIISDIIDTKKIDNYIGDTYDELKNYVALLTSADGNFRTLYFEQIESSTKDLTVGSKPSDLSTYYRWCKPISNNKDFLPLIDKNNKIYYKECMGDTETLEPDYSTKYKIYESDLITPIKTKFTSMYMTSIGIFAFDKNDKIYLNKIYENSNGFISIGNYTQSPWVGSERTDGNHVNPYVQETKYGIFILYGTHIFRYENDTLVEAFAGVSTGYWTKFTNLGAFQTNFNKYYNGSLITDQNRNVGYKLIISEDGNNIFFGFKNSGTSKHQFYKYNYTNKRFESHFECDATYPCVVDEISSGIYVSYGDTKVRNLISNSDITGSSGNGIYSINENPVTREIKYIDTPRIIETFKFDKDLILEIEYSITTTPLLQGQQSLYAYYDIIKYNEDIQIDTDASSFNQNTDMKKLLYSLYPIYKDDGNIDYFYYCSKNNEYTDTYGIINKLSLNIPDDNNPIVLSLDSTTDKKYFSIVKNDDNVFKFLLYKNVIFFSNVELFVSGYKISRDIEISEEQDGSEFENKSIGYQFKFIGENNSIWNNDLEDNSLTTKNKFITTCIGLMDLQTNEFAETYHDMNNYTGEQESVSGINALYKELYMTNNSKRKHNTLFKTSNISKISMLNDFPIVDTSIFDNQNFTIDLIIYPSEFVEDKKIKIVQPYNSTKPILTHKSYLPFDPYYD